MMNVQQNNPHQIQTSVSVTLPDWIKDFNRNVLQQQYQTPEAQMTLTLDLLERQIAEKTGGPFAAIIFDQQGWVTALGVNRVVPENNSTAHAEMVAFQLAERAVGDFTLANRGQFTLATSAQPCAQCYGAGAWAGINQLIVAATADDTEQLLGFDEGPITKDWKQQYERRGIKVVQDLMRDRAKELMQKYDGAIYNGQVREGFDPKKS